jgi:hypothetical protein
LVIEGHNQGKFVVPFNIEFIERTYEDVIGACGNADPDSACCLLQRREHGFESSHKGSA